MVRLPEVKDSEFFAKNILVTPRSKQYWGASRLRSKDFSFFQNIYFCEKKLAEFQERKKMFKKIKCYRQSKEIFSVCRILKLHAFLKISLR